MKCPKCFKLSTEVTDSRPMNEGEDVRRRRRCRECRYRFSTIETLKEYFSMEEVEE